MKKLLFASFALAMIFAGCNKEEQPQGGGNGNTDDLRIPIRISMGQWTKVTDTEYESGDKVGIYVVNFDGGNAGSLKPSGNHVDNVGFAYNSSEWTPDREIYWKDNETKADFYCYYPYQASVSTTSQSFSVKADQSALENYKASEFLWGKASSVSPTADAVPVITNRVMSNMLVYVKPGKGFTDESLSQANVSVEICNVKTQASVNLNTGIATAAGEVTTVKPYFNGEYYRAMIVPQQVADGTNLINITVDGVVYSFAKGITFEANKKHKFTVTVNKVNGGIDIGIGGWEEGGEDNGGAAE